MEILIVAVLIGLIPAIIAKGKGQSFGLWWLYGAALFIIALPHSIIMKANNEEIEHQQLSEGMKKCPHCAELIKREAVVCRYCNRELTDQMSSQTKDSSSVTSLNDEQLMKEFNVTFDGKRYCYESYRYDKLADAISYAKSRG